MTEESNSRRLIQITKRRLTVDRLPRGQEPVYETHLEPWEEIVGVAYELEHDFQSRKTVDHTLSVYVATALGGEPCS